MLAAQPAMDFGCKILNLHSAREHSPLVAQQHASGAVATQSYEPVSAARPQAREPSGNSAPLEPGLEAGVGPQQLEQLLPRMTRVLIRGNNRTKSSLVGKEGVVKRSNGLGGWHLVVRHVWPPLHLGAHRSSVSGVYCHWPKRFGAAAQVLESGEEVRLQRNALTVLSVPRGDETVRKRMQTRPSGHNMPCTALLRRLHLPRCQRTARLRNCSFRIANI